MGSGASKFKKTCPDASELVMTNITSTIKDNCDNDTATLLGDDIPESSLPDETNLSVIHEPPINDTEISIQTTPHDTRESIHSTRDPLLLEPIQEIPIQDIQHLMNEKEELWESHTRIVKESQIIEQETSHSEIPSPCMESIMTLQDQKEFLNMISLEREALKEKEKTIRSESYRLKTEILELKEKNQEYIKRLEESDEKMSQMRQELVELRKDALMPVTTESKSTAPMTKPPAYPGQPQPPNVNTENSLERIKKLEKKVLKLKHTLNKERMQHAVKVFEMETELKELKNQSSIMQSVPKRPAFDPVALELEQQIKNRNQIILDLSMRLNDLEDQLNKNRKEGRVEPHEVEKETTEESTTWSSKWSIKKMVDPVALAL